MMLLIGIEHHHMPLAGADFSFFAPLGFWGSDMALPLVWVGILPILTGILPSGSPSLPA